MAIGNCMVVLRPPPASGVDVESMLLHTNVSRGFTAA